MRLARPAETAAPETMSRTRTGSGRAEARPYHKKPTSLPQLVLLPLLVYDSGHQPDFLHRSNPPHQN